jgi:DNA helicase-2/ATP-dependent DNA helicase PcrA
MRELCKRGICPKLRGQAAIIERLHQRYKTNAPSVDEVMDLVSNTFHLKHIFPSNDPINRPGPYERAYNSAEEIAKNYVNSFAQDFERLREDEARFEITIGQAMVSGAIDLLLKRDELGNVVDAHVIDFKSMDTPDETTPNDWIDLSLQVQLYAYAANEVLGERTKTGSVHLLKEQGEKARVNIPVSNEAVGAAIENISWAVDRILDDDFPMRPCAGKCQNCDVKRICSKAPQEFKLDILPPSIHVPTEDAKAMIRAFSEFKE